MANMQGFDANTVEPNKGFELLPSGDQEACITESSEKTSEGGGQYFAFTFEITRGEHKGRKLWHNCNMVNKNAEAVRIGRGDLSAICRATGVMTPKDTSDLHNIPLTINVGQKKNKQTNEMQNVIKAFKPAGAAPAPATASTPAATGNTPPWKK